MALSYYTLREFPYLPTYEAASRHEASVTPIRGDANQRKPLGKRNQKYRYIKRDTVTGNITIHLGYSKPSIIYKPDGNIELYGPNWSCKAAVGEAIGTILGWRWKSYDHYLWVHTTTGWHPLERGEFVAFKPQLESKTSYVASQQHVTTTTIRDTPIALKPVTVVTHTVNREGKKKVLEQFKPFLAYVDAMLKVMLDPDPDKYQQPISNELLSAAFGFEEHAGYGGRVYKYPKFDDMSAPGSWGFNHGHAKSLVEEILSSDPEDNYKAFLRIGKRCYGPANTVRKSFRRKAERVLAMHYYDQWFAKNKVSPASNVIRDRYQWAIPPQPKA